jgi:hypothetical protein
VNGEAFLVIPDTLDASKKKRQPFDLFPSQEHRRLPGTDLHRAQVQTWMCE